MVSHVQYLKPRQEAFIRHWVEHQDDAEAYRVAYGAPSHLTDDQVRRRGQSVRAGGAVAAAIERKMERAILKADNQLMGNVGEAFDKWVEIFLADPDELSGLRIGCCRYCWGEGNRYQWKEREYLAEMDRAEQVAQDESKPPRYPDIAGGFGYRFTNPPNPDCEECEGEGKTRMTAVDTSQLSAGARALYGGIKLTKEGPQVIIADRMKALDSITRMLGGYQDKLQLGGGVAAMIAVVGKMAATTDPEEAGRLYQEMISSNAAST